jgi:hypothetical protein
MKFKVGDKVKGISNEYLITNKDMYLGEIIDISTNTVKIKILEHKNSFCVGNEYDAINPDGRFEIVENLTISQLQSEIDKLSNKVQEEYSNVISNRDKVNYLKKQLKQLKEENKKEKNKPILDDEEKEYLNAVIRPFKNRISNIVKKNFDSEKSYIVIHINSESFYFPYFKKGTMYEGMEADKQYTLKELGLDE